jgi:anthranilate synthase component 1
MNIRPTLEEAKQFASGYTVVPIAREMFSDIRTPIEVLKNIARRSNGYYLLESVEGGEKWGRYSFLGYDPIAYLKIQDGKLEYDSGVCLSEDTGDPNQSIRTILNQYKAPRVEDFPPFTGGFVGYFSYEYSKYSMPVSFTGENEADFPDCELMLFDKVIVYDHLRQKIILIANVRTDMLETNYKKATVELQTMADMVRETAQESFGGTLASEILAERTEEEFTEIVNRIKNHIREGDIFQAVPSIRMSAKYEGSLLSAYRVLRTINPSPYMIYIKCRDLEIAGASPETLITLKNGKLSTYPLAGSRPRGKTEEEDERLKAELLSDEKELAEHNMLVDLARNDLGKVSKFGSVKVEEYLKVLRYSHISHISSCVTGELMEGYDALDVLASVLPAGTLSGAPKIRAMEILNELEASKRGVYGGAVGYLDFAGNMNLCIAIRMAVKRAGRVYVQAGAGIVAQSEPEKEYVECRNKALAMLEAIKASKEAEEE